MANWIAFCAGLLVGAVLGVWILWTVVSFSLLKYVVKKEKSQKSEVQHG